MSAAASAYEERFRRVLEHIEGHLDEELTVERLGGIAAFSKFHFHRQFSQLFGIGVYEYVKLVRLKRASYKLAFLNFLYSVWLPQSGEEPRDFPLFLQRVRMFPDVPEHEAITDVFLPIK